MTSNSIWLNLPVRDVSRSHDFYEKIGFEPNSLYGLSEDSASFFIGEHKIVLMLFHEEQFKKYICSELADLSTGNEVLFSLSAESRQEVDDMVISVKEAGGVIFAEPKENQGWMYGMGFADVDGHKWNVLYMDITNLPQEE